MVAHRQIFRAHCSLTKEVDFLVEPPTFFFDQNHIEMQPYFELHEYMSLAFVYYFKYEKFVRYMVINIFPTIFMFSYMRVTDISSWLPFLSLAFYNAFLYQLYYTGFVDAYSFCADGCGLKFFLSIFCVL